MATSLAKPSARCYTVILLRSGRREKTKLKNQEKKQKYSENVQMFAYFMALEWKNIYL